MVGVADITVRITSYNRPEYLREALLSVLSQDVKAKYIEIYDNCSNEDVYSNIKDLIVGNVKWKPTKKNIGGTANIERAFKNVSTKYLYIMHDDDRLLPSFIAKQVEFLENDPECSAVSCNAEKIDFEGKRLNATWFGDDLETCQYRGKEEIALLYADSYLGFPSIVYRVSLVGSIKIKTELGKCMDVGIISDVAEKGSVVYQNQILMEYRTHIEQDSSEFPIEVWRGLLNFLKSSAKTPEVKKNIESRFRKMVTLYFVRTNFNSKNWFYALKMYHKHIFIKTLFIKELLVIIKEKIKNKIFRII